MANPTDPLFSEQWHIKNTGSIAGSVAGVDLNVLPAWDAVCACLSFLLQIEFDF